MSFQSAVKIHPHSASDSALEEGKEVAAEAKGEEEDELDQKNNDVPLLLLLQLYFHHHTYSSPSTPPSDLHTWIPSAKSEFYHPAQSNHCSTHDKYKILDSQSKKGHIHSRSQPQGRCHGRGSTLISARRWRNRVDETPGDRQPSSSCGDFRRFRPQGKARGRRGGYRVAGTRSRGCRDRVEAEESRGGEKKAAPASASASASA